MRTPWSNQPRASVAALATLRRRSTAGRRRKMHCQSGALSNARAGGPPANRVTRKHCSGVCLVDKRSRRARRGQYSVVGRIHNLGRRSPAGGRGRCSKKEMSGWISRASSIGNTRTFPSAMSFRRRSAAAPGCRTPPGKRGTSPIEPRMRSTSLVSTARKRPFAPSAMRWGRLQTSNVTTAPG
jgi:hypothetical protein